MSDEVLATAEASAARRWLGIGMLAAIGGLVIYVAFSSPPSLGWQVFLVAMGVGALWMAVRMRRATESQIVLTEQGLHDASGIEIARVEDIVSLDRGFFAFKPSNGFMIRTRSAAGRVWRPGLWWRMGRRIGVGGVVPGYQAKNMAEILAAMLAMRDQKGAG